jgi:aryl-alcohol dehydrogenase-like predicted oxidoreductase
LRASARTPRRVAGGDVEQRPLGGTGIPISAIGFGCGTAGGLMNKGEPREQRAIVERAAAAGITYFDTAPNYGEGLSETNLGRAIRELGIRDQVQIGTKVGLLEPDVADADVALRSIFDGSLRRLGVDDVDMLFLHSRVQHVPDERGISRDGAEQVAATFQRVKDQGLTRLAGFTAHGETDAVKALARHGLYDTAQAYFSAANPSAGYAGHANGEQDFGGVIDDAAAAGLGIINIQPLSAGGLLAQAHPYARDFTHGRLLGIGERLAELADELELESVYELALRFALAKPGISCVLIGFSSMHQLEQAIRWSDRGPLAPQQVSRVLEVGTPVGELVE